MSYVQSHSLGKPRRRRPAGRAAGFWLSVALLHTPAVPAQECRCEEISARGALRDAEAVFVGRVVNVEQEEQGEQAEEGAAAEEGLIPLFEVHAAWKGVGQDRLQVFGGETACGLSYRVGKDYLVFARRVRGELVADQCSGTKRLELAARDLRLIGPARRVFRGDRRP